MKTEIFSFAGQGSCSLPARLWLPEGEVTGVLQLTHGMTEHCGRYAALAEALTARGVAVAGFDLRGHGGNPCQDGLAVFGKGGWEASLGDMRQFFELLDTRFPGVPHWLHGFSLGSFLVREYLARWPEGVAGAVILGTGCQPGWLLALMSRIVDGQIRKVGFDGYSPLVRQLSFGTYNQKFKPNRTEKDWLCSDEGEIDAFLADPLCRENFSAGLFSQMLAAMGRTGKPSIYGGYHREMPILLISGENDPVGNMGRGPRAVKQSMEAAGLKTVELHLLPLARHDVLHEESCGAAAQARALICEFVCGVKV